MFCNCRTFCRVPERPLSYWVDRAHRACGVQAVLCVCGIAAPLLAHVYPSLLALCCCSSALSGITAALLFLLLRDKPRPLHTKIQTCIWVLLVSWSCWCAQLLYTQMLGVLNEVPG